MPKQYFYKMKKALLYFVFTNFILLSSTLHLNAQEKKKELVASLGVGHSNGFTVLTVLQGRNSGGWFSRLYHHEMTKISASPVITAGFEYIIN